jgi:hypothetical protein
MQVLSPAPLFAKIKAICKVFLMTFSDKREASYHQSSRIETPDSIKNLYKWVGGLIFLSLLLSTERSTEGRTPIKAPLD